MCYTQISHNLFEQMAGRFIDTPESEVILYNIKYLLSVFNLKSSCYDSLHVTPLYYKPPQINLHVALCHMYLVITYTKEVMFSLQFVSVCL